MDDYIYEPEIDGQYVLYYQYNGECYYTTFTYYEDEDPQEEFKKALEFSKTHDVLRFFEEPTLAYFNPKTGEEVETPDCGRYCKNYYDQPTQPYQYNFTAVDIDELPF